MPLSESRKAQLDELFQSDVETGQQSREYQLERAFTAVQEDKARGGSIRQAPVERNPPYGAVIGGTAGFVLGSGTGNPAAAAGLATLGAAGGEAAQQLVEHTIGSPAAPQTTVEAGGRMLEESGWQLVGEGIGRAIGMPLVGRTVVRPSKYVTKEGADAMRFMEPRTAQGFLPAEVTDSWGTDILHNVAENALIGGGAIKKFKGNRDVLFQGIADELVDSLGVRMNADNAGRALIGAIHNNKDIAGIPTQMIYNSIERMAAPEYVPVPVKMSVKRVESDVMEPRQARQVVQSHETTVPTSDAEQWQQLYETGKASPEKNIMTGLNVKTTWQDVKVGERLEHLKVMVATQEQQVSGAKIDLSPIKVGIEGFMRTAKQAGGLADREMGTSLLKFFAEKPDLASYPAAIQMRTEIRTFKEALQNSPESKNAPAIAKANRLYGQLTSQIREGLQKYDPFLAEQWDEANLLERGAHLQFNDKMIRTLIKKSDELGTGAPEKMAQAIFQPNNVTNIKRVKNAVADDAQWTKMLSVELQDLLKKGTTKQGILDGASLEQAMFGRNGLGAETMTAAFGPQRTATYREFINALKVAQGKQSSGTGSMLIEMKQAGAFVQATGAMMAVAGLSSDEYGTEGVLGGAGFIIAPWVLANILTNPGLSKTIIQGMKTPAGTAAATGLTGRIIAAIAPRSSPYEPQQAQQPKAGNILGLTQRQMQ